VRRLSPSSREPAHWDVQREEVQPGFLSILDPRDPKDRSAGRPELNWTPYGPGHWLADPQNPLTTRVMVNRIGSIISAAVS